MLMVNAPLGRTITEVWFGPGQRCTGYMSTAPQHTQMQCEITPGCWQERYLQQQNTTRYSATDLAYGLRQSDDG
jgi:hypothetical protein